MIDGSCATVTGKSLAENLKDYPGLTKEQNILHSINSPIKESGHIRILKGNLAKDGAVAKLQEKKVFSLEEEQESDQRS